MKLLRFPFQHIDRLKLNKRCVPAVARRLAKSSLLALRLSSDHTVARGRAENSEHHKSYFTQVSSELKELPPDSWRRSQPALLRNATGKVDDARTVTLFFVTHLLVGNHIASRQSAGSSLAVLQSSDIESLCLVRQASPLSPQTCDSLKTLWFRPLPLIRDCPLLFRKIFSFITATLN